MTRKILQKSAVILGFLLLLISIVILFRAFESRSLPEFDPWHTWKLKSEFRSEMYHSDFTLAEYLTIESSVFRELDDKITNHINPTETNRYNRYNPGGINNAGTFPVNWNKTFELIPETIRGGALLLHGLTDSPYSLRAEGQILKEKGYYVLGLRLPGHGTIPGALVDLTWQDMAAAVEIGASHVQTRIGPQQPYLILGYSNGATLALNHVLGVLESPNKRMPDRLILFSPAMGITPYAVFANWHKLFSWFPAFEKFQWSEIYPEYDPFKYNSFPKNGGGLNHFLIQRVQKKVVQAAKTGQIELFPPILTFQSVVDDTVEVQAVIDCLYGLLPGGGHELVVFDINRNARIQAYINPECGKFLIEAEQNFERQYRLTTITNFRKQSDHVAELIRQAGSSIPQRRNLNLQWPPGIYSLSHVAIPFEPTDAIYGDGRSAPASYGVLLGTLEPRGERDVLRIPHANLMRLRYNPFFEYIHHRLVEITSLESSRQVN